MSEREYESLQSALASARMEGLPVSPHTEHDCIRVLNGEISISDLVQKILLRSVTVV